MNEIKDIIITWLPLIAVLLLFILIFRQVLSYGVLKLLCIIFLIIIVLMLIMCVCALFL